MTTWLNVKNNAESALIAAITAAAATLTLITGDGAKFPSSNFNITIDDEILLCSSRTGDVLTVTRAQEGTTAAIHPIGAIVALNVTAGVITQMQAAIDSHTTEVSGVHSFNKSCGVHNSAAQSIASGTDVILTFDTEDWDTDNIHNSTNPTRLTCKTAGLYLIVGLCLFAANSTGRRVLSIFLNGSTVVASTSQMPITDSGSGTNMSLAGLYNLAVNDYVELWCKQVSGSTLTTSSSFPTRFYMVRIA